MRILFLSVIVCCSGFSAFAADQCDAEAQIIAEVVERKTDSLTYCKAMVSAESISFYRGSVNCSLGLGEVIEKGIQMPLSNGHDCDVQSGDVLTGVVYKKGDKIEFEKL